MSKPEKLFVMLREIVECCHEGEEFQARKYGLTTAQARALVAIRFHNCRTTADLAEVMFVVKSRVTRILDGLVDKGFIRRIEHSDDRRLKLIRLTRQGERITDELMEFILYLHSDVLGSLPRSFHDETLSVLASLKEAMNATRYRLRRGEFDKDADATDSSD